MVHPSIVPELRLWGTTSSRCWRRPDFKNLKGCLHPKSDLLIFLCHLCAGTSSALCPHSCSGFSGLVPGLSLGVLGLQQLLAAGHRVSAPS